MGTLHPITQHTNFVPCKVRAELFYGIDSNLDENARSLYKFLLGVSTMNYGITYIPWATTDIAIEELYKSDEWGKDLQMYAIRNAFSLLRKNRYLRHTYVRVLDARVLELLDYIGENARN